MAFIDVTDDNIRPFAKALGLPTKQDVELLEQCVMEGEDDRDADYLLFDIDSNEYTQYKALKKMLRKDKDVDLSNEIGDNDEERFINFLIRMNYQVFVDNNIPFAHMRGVVMTHELADGWAVVSPYNLNGRKGISSAQLTRHKNYTGSAEQQAWVNLFLKTHEEAPDSGLVGLTLSAEDND